MSNEEIIARHADERTKCTVYTRVMGYHRPVETFNAGKQGEFADRKHYSEPKKTEVIVPEPGCPCSK